MRPRIIDILNDFTGVEIFQYIVPFNLPLFIFAFLIVIFFTLKETTHRDISKNDTLDVMLAGFIAAILGSRLLFVLWNFDKFISKPVRAVKIWEGGFSFLGGVFLGIIGAMLIIKRKRINPYKIADCVSPGLFLGLFIMKIGCFLNGDDFGRVSNLPWAVRFPKYSIPFNFQLKKGLIDNTFELSLPVHPAQLYEAFIGLFIYFLTRMRYWKKRREGELFLFCSIAYLTSRYLIDFLRGDLEKNIFNFLTYSQVFSIVFLIIIFFLISSQRAQDK